MSAQPTKGDGGCCPAALPVNSFLICLGKRFRFRAGLAAEGARRRWRPLPQAEATTEAAAETPAAETPEAETEGGPRSGG